MLKGTLLTTIGILGVVWCFFLPLGMQHATTTGWVAYGIVTTAFFVTAAVGMNIRSKYIAASRDNTNLK